MLFFMKKVDSLFWSSASHLIQFEFVMLPQRNGKFTRYDIPDSIKGGLEIGQLRDQIKTAQNNSYG